GQSAPVALAIPLRGYHSLGITERGVYPLLINVNGRPDYGGKARLAALSVLLPVLDPPGGKPRKPPARPAALTLLWPIVDERPRAVGLDGGHIVLADDGLADSLAFGGRLFGLVNAVDQAASRNSALYGALCFAIDPDLLDTVDAMSHGYLVRGPD